MTNEHRPDELSDASALAELREAFDRLIAATQTANMHLTDCWQRDLIESPFLYKGWVVTYGTSELYNAAHVERIFTVSELPTLDRPDLNVTQPPTDG